MMHQPPPDDPPFPDPVIQPRPRLTNALMDVTRERIRQDQQWGGEDHDDRLGVATWLLVLMVHIGKAAVIGNAWSEEYEEAESENWQDLRHRLIAIAAVCVAFVEAMDRSTKRGQPKW